MRNTMGEVLKFAENRGKEADMLTSRLGQVFMPVAEMFGQSVDPQQQPMMTPQQPPAPQGGLGASNPALIQSESGGNWAAQNQAVGSGGHVGHFGRAQFGVARLEDAKRAGVIPPDMTPQQFMNDPAAQVAAEQWHEQDIMSFAERSGITDRIGQTVAGVPVTREGIMNVAHLGGNAGMRRFFESDGAYNPADANGTRLSDYLAMGAGQRGGSPVDDTYRSLGDALGVTVSTSGSLNTNERRDVESMLGEMLNTVYDPETAMEDEKRNRMADLFTGLGVGFGQMSRGDQVDLSEVRGMAERRRNQNIQLRMERAKRAAGAQLALDMGDESMASAIAGGAADTGTLFTKRQQDMVERRANEQITRQAAQAGYLADALQDSGLPASKIEAIRNGVDPATILRVAEMSKAAEAAAAAQERIESQMDLVENLREQAMAARDATAAGQDAPPMDPILERAIELAQLDGYGKIRTGGSLYDYMSEARQQAGEMRQQEAAAAPAAPSAKEQQIARIMEANPDVDRATAINIADGVVQIDSEGTLRSTVDGQPVTGLRAGRSVEPDAATLDGPPRDTTGTSLFNRVGQVTGAVSGLQGVLSNTVGQGVEALGGDPLFPERTETIQEFNTMRGQLIDAFRNSGRMLSQELQLLLQEVAPGSSVFQSPGQLQIKMDSIDRELRRRLVEERARASDPAVPAKEQAASADLANSLDRVLTRLHSPQGGAGSAEEPTTEGAALPDEVRRSPAFARIESAAQSSGVTPEEVWQFLSDEAKQRFLQGAQ